MRKRVVVASGVVASVMAVVLGAPALAAGQTRAEIEEAARKASFRSEEEASKAWEAELAKKKAEAVAKVYDPSKPLPANPPKTPWGHPDLREVITSPPRIRRSSAPVTSTSRCTRQEEAIGAFATQADTDASADPAVVHYDWKEFGMEAWQSPVRPNMRTALIVEPASGTVPALTPEAQKRRADAAALAKTRDHQTGVGIFANLYTRCILGLGAIPLVRGGQPGSTEATSAGVSTEIQIFQTPDYVTIVHQSNSDVRIIPLAARPHLPQTVRQWNGDSRGRWEGNTLVVETTNFNDPAPSANFQGSTDSLKIVERFSVLDANTLRYQYTVTDPKTWTTSWSAEAPLPRIDPPLYEFACHEQNYGLINLVMGAQIRATEGKLDPRDPRAGAAR